MSFNLTKTLVKIAMLSNLLSNDQLGITPMISGPHGHGKSAMMRKVGKELGGFTVVIDGSTTKEGDMVGLPLAAQNADGSKYVQNIAHAEIAKIQRTEAYLYKKLNAGGFLNGRVKMYPASDFTDKDVLPLLDSNNNEIAGTDGEVLTEVCKVMTTEAGAPIRVRPGDLVVFTAADRKAVKYICAAKTEAQQIFQGTINANNFGNDLKFEEKLELLRTGEIAPVVIFVDELNKADQYTTIELMNIVLNKEVSGYNLPWYSFFCSAVNPVNSGSSYQGNEMDPAQRDRFLKIPFNLNVDEWAEHQLTTPVTNQAYITAVASLTKSSPDANIFYENNNAALVDQDKPTTSPRSHEIAMTLLAAAEAVTIREFGFNDDEIKNSLGLAEKLIRYKLGDAGQSILQTMKNPEFLIIIDDILTGKSKTIDKDVKEKLKSKTGNMTIIHSFLGKAAILFLARELAPEYTQAKIKKKGFSYSTRYENIMSQFKEFLDLVNDSTVVTFAKLSATTKFESWTDPEDGRVYKAGNLYNLVYKLVPTTIISQLDAIANTDY